MNLLIDTHALLWYTNGSNELPLPLREQMDDAQSVLFVSIASLWEIGIKTSRGKLTPSVNLESFFNDLVLKGFKILPVSTDHILKVSQLPFLHTDPFDRIIIAQAIVEGITVVTIDSDFPRYAKQENLKIIWKK